MKRSMHFILAFGIVLAFVCSAWSKKIEDDIKSKLDLESRTGEIKDMVEPRIHHHHGHHHDHHHSALHHHGHIHHALHHKLTHTALHHPILTKKLLLLKFKKIGAIHHHHHHKHKHGFHHHHHDVHKHLLPLLHHHHHLLRGSGGPDTDSIIEVIPISDTTGALSSFGANPTSSHLHDTPTIQTYTVPSDYLEGINDGTDESDLENYEEINLDETPESSPINKHLIAADDPYNEQPVYLYAVPQQVDLGRSVVGRFTKNKKKFKN